MGTASSIWREKANGKYDGITCQFDGYIENMGVTLFRLFGDKPNTTELIRSIKSNDEYHISSIDSILNYKGDEKGLENYKERIKKYQNEKGTEVLSLNRSKANVVYYPSPKNNLSENQINYRQREIERLTNVDKNKVAYTGFDYYQKQSGKWYVITGISLLGTEEYITVDVPLKDILMLMKKGLIKDNELKLKDIYNPDVLKLFITNNSEKNTFINILKEITLKNIGLFFVDKNELQIINTIINNSEISTWVQIMKKLRPNIEFYDVLSVIKNNENILIHLQDLLVIYFLNDLELNHYKEYEVYEFIKNENIKQVLNLYINTKTNGLFITYSKKDELTKISKQTTEQSRQKSFDF